MIWKLLDQGRSLCAISARIPINISNPTHPFPAFRVERFICRVQTYKLSLALIRLKNRLPLNCATKQGPVLFFNEN